MLDLLARSDASEVAATGRVKAKEASHLTASGGQTQGKVVAVWGAIGSPGKSTIAANLACELATAGKRVFLLDADTYAPSLADLFGLFEHPAGLPAACRILGQDRFDLEQLQRLSLELAIGKKSLTLMTGIGSNRRWAELTAERLSDMLQLAKANFDFVLVDLASPLESGLSLMHSSLSRNEATRTAIALADQVIAVANADPIGIQRFVEQLPELPATGEVLPVINRLRSSALGVRPKQQIAETLLRLVKLEPAAFIPVDQEAFDFALLNNLPLALAKRHSPARQATNDFAKQYLLRQPSELERRIASPKLG